MSKLAQIRSIIAEAKDMLEEVEREVVESVGEYNATLAEFNTLKDSISLSELEEMKDALASIKNLPSQSAPSTMECEERLTHIDPPASFELKEPKSGTFAAKFWGFIVAVLVFVGLGAVGAYFKNLNFDPSLIDMKFVEDAFGFYSDLITGSSGSAAALGIAVAAFVSIITGYIVYWVMVNAAASSNLSKAQALFEEAKEYVNKQKEFLQRVKAWREFLQKVIDTVKSAKIFSDELSAKVTRIKFFEGDDFTKYKETSKEDVKDLLRLNEQLIVFTTMELCKEGDAISPEVENFFDELYQSVENIKKRVYS